MHSFAISIIHSISFEFNSKVLKVSKIATSQSTLKRAIQLYRYAICTSTLGCRQSLADNSVRGLASDADSDTGVRFSSSPSPPNSYVMRQLSLLKIRYLEGMAELSKFITLFITFD